MEAFFRSTTTFRGSTLDPRFYRSVTKLLGAIEGGWISPKDKDSSYEVVMFTDHEAWDKDFSPAELNRVIDEAVDDLNRISLFCHAATGSWAADHPDYNRLCKEWRDKHSAKIRSAVRGAIK